MLIRLQARASGANIRRAWTAVVGRDLFGAVCLDITFGRIGTLGQTQHHSFEREADAARFLMRALRRRARSPRRIGVGYWTIEASDAAEPWLGRAGIPLDGDKVCDLDFSIPEVPKGLPVKDGFAAQPCFKL